MIVLGAIGAVAYLLLGGGSKTYAVPQVQGLSQSKAETKVTQAHLKPVTVKQASATVASGHVVASSPPFGNLEPAGTVVTLFVLTGPRPVNVPNVVGLNISQAQNTVSSKGLSTHVRTNPNSTQPQGTVIRQNPLAGTPVKPGSSVTLVVSGGGVKVPNEIGQSLQVAQAALQGFGLSSTVSSVPATGGTTPGTVVGMSPTPGTVVPKGTSITLQVAKQQPTTPPPTTTSPPPTSSPPTSPPTTGPNT